ncbi:MAG: cytidine deaminase [Opitutus sp.]|nr:cytidine deaminase [Opitutus sp.]
MPSKLSLPLRRRLEQAARAAAQGSYSPYSKFRVGAAVLAGSGKIYAGSNVENASYGLCNCAERTAIFTAAAQGERTLRCVVVYTPTRAPTMPCGACRQVLNEFGPQATVLAICDSDECIETTLDYLLPDAFGPENLLKDSPASSSRKAR